MPALTLAQLIIALAPLGVQGINLINTLIQKWNTNSTVSIDEWNSLYADLKKTPADHMTAQLQAAGIDLNSPQAQALLALCK